MFLSVWFLEDSASISMYQVSVPFLSLTLTLVVSRSIYNLVPSNPCADEPQPELLIWIHSAVHVSATLSIHFYLDPRLNTALCFRTLARGTPSELHGVIRHDTTLASRSSSLLVCQQISLPLVQLLVCQVL